MAKPFIRLMYRFIENGPDGLPLDAPMPGTVWALEGLTPETADSRNMQLKKAGINWRWREEREYQEWKRARASERKEEA